MDTHPWGSGWRRTDSAGPGGAWGSTSVFPGDANASWVTRWEAARGKRHRLPTPRAPGTTVRSSSIGRSKAKFPPSKDADKGTILIPWVWCRKEGAQRLPWEHGRDWGPLDGRNLGAVLDSSPRAQWSSGSGNRGTDWTEGEHGTPGCPFHPTYPSVL